MKCSIKVIRPGACTTVQDLGRIGYQKFGIPVAGVMDEFAASVANFLVGNERNEAVLEITYLGPTLEFQEDMLIGIAGANVSPKLNGVPVPVWEGFTVKKGDVLSFGSVKGGVRAYIAFAGSIDVPLVNGSKSTLMKSKIGGFQGRMLQAGDELSICVRQGTCPQRLPAHFIPIYPHSNDIAVCLGPQDDYFTEQGISDFFGQPYTITANADRMGIRLDGAAVAHKTKADIISDAAVIGSIQVPADGKPIILMADRQTTGGYAKIGTVIKEDIIKLAQMASNDTIQFRRISMEEAQQKYRTFYQKLEEIRSSLQALCNTGIQACASGTAVNASAGGPTGKDSTVASVPDAAGNTAAAVKETVCLPVAGTVSKMAVKTGDTVKEGDLLFTFEAMKMENDMTAPCSGTIGRIYKKAGGLADAGEPVLEIV
ncbi:5-oxoprolinase/urea amidolyase family protein [Treponema vincentii]|uniref:5-oxoprolinase/urea amidolyase family protein n=1 Tax=Treponema vincentii TaxID=69710 RepID=UPI0035F533D6